MKSLKEALITALTAAILLTGCKGAGGETETTADTSADTAPANVSETTAESASETVFYDGEPEEDIEDTPEEVYDEPEEVLDEPEGIYTAVPETTAGFASEDDRTFEQKMQVGTLDEYGGVSFDGDEYIILSVTLPENMEVPEEGGFFVINTGAVWHASDGYSPENFKTDMVSGRTVTVYGEETCDDGTYEYMLHSSVPDHYSENGIYETYLYIVKRGDYLVSVSFTAENYDRETAEKIIGSLEIRAEKTE